LGYMSKAGAGLTQSRTPCDVPEQMKEVPHGLELRRENLPASAVESVNNASLYSFQFPSDISISISHMRYVYVIETYSIEYFNKSVIQHTSILENVYKWAILLTTTTHKTA